MSELDRPGQFGLRTYPEDSGIAEGAGTFRPASSTSINRILAKGLISVAPDDLEFTEIPIRDLPLYSQDYDADFPPEARALKKAIAATDAVLFVTPRVQPLDSRRSQERDPLGVPPLGTELVRPHPRGGDRGFDGLHRHGGRPAGPSRRAQLLQRPPDDGAGGVHPLLGG